MRLSRESKGGVRVSKVSIPKYALDPDLWYSGGRFTVHCWTLLWRYGLMCDGIRNGLDMELPEAILVGRGRGPFTVGIPWRRAQTQVTPLSRFIPHWDPAVIFPHWPRLILAQLGPADHLGRPRWCLRQNLDWVEVSGKAYWFCIH